MKCEKCGKNEANIHMKNIFNGNIVEYHICDSCAKENNLFGEIGGICIESILKGFTGATESEREAEKLKDEKRCPQCSTSYSDFKSGGRLGCDSCYETFREELRTMLEKMNKSSKHIGKVPSRLKEDVKKRLSEDRLKREMEAAVKKEDFEHAAELRDKIKKLQQ